MPQGVWGKNLGKNPPTGKFLFKKKATAQNPKGKMPQNGRWGRGKNRKNTRGGGNFPLRTKAKPKRGFPPFPFPGGGLTPKKNHELPIPGSSKIQPGPKNASSGVGGGKSPEEFYPAQKKEKKGHGDPGGFKNPPPRGPNHFFRPHFYFSAGGWGEGNPCFCPRPVF